MWAHLQETDERTDMEPQDEYDAAAADGDHDYAGVFEYGQVEPLDENESILCIDDSDLRALEEHDAAVPGPEPTAQTRTTSQPDVASRSVLLFCIQWARLYSQVQPHKNAADALAKERKALNAKLTEYMRTSGWQRARVDIDGTPDNDLVIRLDPCGPSSSMQQNVLNAAIFQCASVQLAQLCVERINERHDKAHKKQEAARATAKRKAERAARAAASAGTRRARRRSPPPDDDDHGAAAKGTPSDDLAKSGTVEPEGASLSPTLAEVMGEMLLVATREAQRIAAQDHFRLTVVPKSKDMSSLPIRDDGDDNSGDTGNGNVTDAATDADASDPVGDDDGVKRQVGKKRTAARAFSAAARQSQSPLKRSKIPASVDPRDDDGLVWGNASADAAAWAARVHEIESQAKALRETMAPLMTRLRALTTDAGEPPAEPKGGKAPTARQQETMARHAAHTQLQPMRDNVARYLDEAGVGKRGVPIQLPTVAGCFRLRTSSTKSRTPLSDLRYRPLAVDAARTALRDYSIDPDVPCQADVLSDLLDPNNDDGFRDLLAKALMDHVADHRERTTTVTRVVTLAKVPSGRGRPARPAPPPS